MILKSITSLKLALQPHLVDVSEASEELQMELIEMSEDNILKSLFDNREDPIEIWKNAVEYPRLREHARRLISCFLQHTVVNPHSRT